MPDELLFRNASTYCGEPTLDELLADPLVRLVMSRDRVDEAFVREIAGMVADRIRETASRVNAGHKGEGV